MKQLRIVYSYGVDEYGSPILRRQTLNILDTATETALQTFLNNLASVIQPSIDSAFMIDITQIM